MGFGDALCMGFGDALGTPFAFLHLNKALPDVGLQRLISL
jgi:hypothetical protein